MPNTSRISQTKIASKLAALPYSDQILISKLIAASKALAFKGSQPIDAQHGIEADFLRAYYQIISHMQEMRENNAGLKNEVTALKERTQNVQTTACGQCDTLLELEMRQGLTAAFFRVSCSTCDTHGIYLDTPSKAWADWYKSHGVNSAPSEHNPKHTGEHDD